jgi:hypothetical protein
VLSWHDYRLGLITYPSKANSIMGKLIKLDKTAPKRALEGLNRLTGLQFDRWPESLLPAQSTSEADSQSPEDPHPQRQRSGGL